MTTFTSLCTTIYSFHPGGLLHNVLEDGKLADTDIAICLAELHEACPDKRCCLCVLGWYTNPAYPYEEACRVCYQAQEDCLRLLATLTEDARQAALETWYAMPEAQR